MRWLDDITDLMDVGSSELQEAEGTAMTLMWASRALAKETGTTSLCSVQTE